MLVAFGIVLWITFTNLNRIALRHTLDETIGFVKIRLEQYETDAANDRVKSLVRLLDKTVSLGNEMTLKEGFGTQDLDSFAEQQRLTGALVLDENLNVVMQTTKGGNAMPLWEKLIDSPYVHNIVDYPKKTYSTRLEENGIFYDFAAVARADAPGILITYIQKDNEDIGDLTVDSLLRDFPLELSGIATITENGRVISSNSSKQVNKAIEDCQELYNGTFDAAEDGIVRLNGNQGVWYGSRENTENYALFVFFPASQVFMTRNIVCASYLAIAVMVFLMALLWQTKMEKDALRQHQKRTGIITALGTAYMYISLVDLKKNTVEILKNASDTVKKQKHFALKRSVQQEQIEKIIAEPYREEYLAFADMTTVAERLKGHTSLALASQTVDRQWILTLITPQRKDADGNVTAVLVATRDATEEKRREQKQEDALRDALAAAEHANKAKTVFLNSMSHDIRTPMNAIIGFTALATARIDNIDLVKEYLKKISVSGQHLLSLINDILDMSRIESGKIQLDETEVNLSDVLHDIKTIVSGQFYAKQLELYMDAIDITDEDVYCDKTRLNQILMNLLSNAIKFTPAGGTVSLRVRQLAGQVSGCGQYEFRVKDSGIGMSPEFAQKSFEPGVVNVTYGDLDHGFRFWDEEWLLLTENDIFGMQKRKRLHTKNQGQQLQYFSDIKAGDYVVHKVHGIGRYIGVENVEVDGIHRDYLLLAYAGDDKLYVPVEQVGMLHKYVGSEGSVPRLSKMGGNDWKRTTAKAAKAITELAEELRGETRRLLVLGDGGRLCRDGLAQLGVESELAPAQLLYQNAVGVGLAAEHGTPVSAQELAPVYLRISQAERERNARLQQEATQK